jgi:hypothetical protein
MIPTTITSGLRDKIFKPTYKKYNTYYFMIIKPPPINQTPTSKTKQDQYFMDYFYHVTPQTIVICPRTLNKKCPLCEMRKNLQPQTILDTRAIHKMLTTIWFPPQNPTTVALKQMQWRTMPLNIYYKIIEDFKPEERSRTIYKLDISYISWNQIPKYDITKIKIDNTPEGYSDPYKDNITITAGSTTYLKKLAQKQAKQEKSSVKPTPTPKNNRTQTRKIDI